MFKFHSYTHFTISMLLLAAVAVVAVAPSGSAARTCQAVDEGQRPDSAQGACASQGKCCCCAVREEAASCQCSQPQPPSNAPPERESGRSSLTWAPGISTTLDVVGNLLLAAPPFGSSPGHQFVSPLAGSLQSRLCVWQN